MQESKFMLVAPLYNQKFTYTKKSNINIFFLLFEVKVEQNCAILGQLE